MKSLRVQIVLLLSLMGILAGCAKVDPYAGLSMEVDWESIEMIQETFNKKDTFTKFYVTLRNSGKEPIYLDAKFWFQIVTVEDQDKQRLAENGVLLKTTMIEAEEISFLSLNSWNSVSGVFEVMEPYTEASFLVAIKLPVDTFLYTLELYDAQQSSKRLGIGDLFKFCPDPLGATAISLGLKMGEKCENGKVISIINR